MLVQKAGLPGAKPPELFAKGGYYMERIIKLVKALTELIRALADLIRLFKR